MAIAATIDGIMVGISAAIEAAVEAGIEAAIEEGVGAFVAGAIAQGLVALGVDAGIAAGMAEEFVGIELESLVGQLAQALSRALAILPEAPLLLFSLPTSGLVLVGDNKPALHPVQVFAQSIGEKLSPKLTAELQKQVKDALESAKDDSKKYLSEQKSSIIKTSLIPFYGWVEGPIELSHLKENTMKQLRQHANANIAKLRAQWQSNSVVQNAITKDVEDFEKTDEWKYYVSSQSSGGGDKIKKEWDGSVELVGSTADGRVRWLMEKKNMTQEAAREKVRTEFPGKV